MCSYEDRIRAVELYIKLGKRVRATIRQLGYPTRPGTVTVPHPKKDLGKGLVQAIRTQAGLK